jgi:hypothetical protein
LDILDKAGFTLKTTETDQKAKKIRRFFQDPNGDLPVDLHNSSPGHPPTIWTRSNTDSMLLQAHKESHPDYSGFQSPRSAYQAPREFSRSQLKDWQIQSGEKRDNTKESTTAYFVALALKLIGAHLLTGLSQAPAIS